MQLTGVEGNSADKIRVEIYESVLAEYPEINVLASAPANWNATEAQSVMATFLSTFDKHRRRASAGRDGARRAHGI